MRRPLPAMRGSSGVACAYASALLYQTPSYTKHQLQELIHIHGSAAHLMQPGAPFGGAHDVSSTDASSRAAADIIAASRPSSTTCAAELANAGGTWISQRQLVHALKEVGIAFCRVESASAYLWAQEVSCRGLNAQERCGMACTDRMVHTRPWQEARTSDCQSARRKTANDLGYHRHPQPLAASLKWLACVAVPVWKRLLQGALSCQRYA